MVMVNSSDISVFPCPSFVSHSSSWSNLNFLGLYPFHVSREHGWVDLSSPSAPGGATGPMPANVSPVLLWPSMNGVGIEMWCMSGHRELMPGFLLESFRSHYVSFFRESIKGWKPGRHLDRTAGQRWDLHKENQRSEQKRVYLNSDYIRWVPKSRSIWNIWPTRLPGNIFQPLFSSLKHCLS